MANLFHTGSFTIGSADSGTINVAFSPGSTFTPNYLKCWYGAPAENSFQAAFGIGRGFSDGTREFACHVTDIDRGQAAGVIYGTGTVARDFLYTVSSFGVDQFTLTVVDAPTAASLTIYYECGLVDNVYVGTFTSPTSTGTTNVTAPSFAPNAGEIITITDPNLPANGDIHCILGHTMFDGSDRQVAGSIEKQAGGTAYRFHGADGNGLWSHFSNATREKGALSTTANGFDIVWSAVVAVLAHYGYIVFGVPQAYCEVDAALASSGSPQDFTAQGFQPDVISSIFNDVTTAQLNTQVANISTCMGGAHRGVDGKAMLGVNDSSGNQGRYQDSAALLLAGTPGSTPTLDTEANLETPDSGWPSGGDALEVSNFPALEVRWAQLAMADSTGGPVPTPNIGIAGASVEYALQPGGSVADALDPGASVTYVINDPEAAVTS